MDVYEIKVFTNFEIIQKIPNCVEIFKVFNILLNSGKLSYSFLLSGNKGMEFFLFCLCNKE